MIAPLTTTAAINDALGEHVEDSTENEIVEQSSFHTWEVLKPLTGVSSIELLRVNLEMILKELQGLVLTSQQEIDHPSNH